MMVAPKPAAVADAAGLIKRIGHADIHAQTSHMRASAGAGRSGAGSRAHAADLDAGANLGVCGAREKDQHCEHRTSKRFHFRIPRQQDVTRLHNK